MRIRILALAALALNACSSGGDTVSTQMRVPGNSSLGGIWRGEVMGASGVMLSTVLLITEDGRFLSSAENTGNHCADVAQGSLSATGTAFAGSGEFGIVDYTMVPNIQVDCAFADGSVWGMSSLSGSVLQRSTLTMTAADTTSVGTVMPSLTGTLTFDALYNEPSMLNKLAGSWTDQTGAVITIDSTGDISSQDAATGCEISGNLTIIDSTYNAYAAEVAYSNCQDVASALNGLSATGLATLDDTVHPNVLILGYNLTLPLGDALIIVSQAVKSAGQ